MKNEVKDDEENSRKQLITAFPHLLQDQPSLTIALLSVWRSVQDRIFFHYKQSCFSYFKYLRLGEIQVSRWMLCRDRLAFLELEDDA